MAGAAGVGGQLLQVIEQMLQLPPPAQTPAHAAESASNVSAAAPHPSPAARPAGSGVRQPVAVRRAVVDKMLAAAALRDAVRAGDDAGAAGGQGSSNAGAAVDAGVAAVREQSLPVRALRLAVAALQASEQPDNIRSDQRATAADDHAACASSAPCGAACAAFQPLWRHCGERLLTVLLDGEQAQAGPTPAPAAMDEGPDDKPARRSHLALVADFLLDGDNLATLLLPSSPAQLSPAGVSVADQILAAAIHHHTLHQSLSTAVSLLLASWLASEPARALGCLDAAAPALVALWSRHPQVGATWSSHICTHVLTLVLVCII